MDILDEDVLVALGAAYFIDSMAKASTTIEADFDPLSPSLLRDPKYNGNNDIEFLQTEAIRIHQERLVRIVQRIRDLLTTRT
ncbi:hypothetical protein BD408DRAFT_429073 [Parasitella parasitica]|nr:hypothetical protein BD408DRAFT_429073 [Parasitella parasitica]